MPHQCVRCGEMYSDGAKEILSGCPCGSKFFFFISKAHLKKAQKQIHLTKDERVKIEQDVKELVGHTEIEKNEPVFLDIESIRILKQGKYDIDLIDLFKKEPLVYKLEDGKYMIDLVSTFKAKQKS